jgi:hypothetical protein
LVSWIKYKFILIKNYPFLGYSLVHI